MDERGCVTVADVTDRIAAVTDALGSVYRDAFCAPPYDEPPEVADRFVGDQLPRHAERAGFVREGARRKAYRRHGELVDGVLYGLVREDLEP